MHPGLFSLPSPSGAQLTDSGGAREIRKVARALARTLRDAEAREVVRLAKSLTAQGDRPLAYELLWAHPRALEGLRPSDVVALGKGIAHWGTVDHFACFVAGQAWRRGLIEDALVLRWARSKDRFWRRAAVVSTVPLNRRSQGGEGDAPRTIKVCTAVTADRDDLVVKALSWALRELSVRDRRAVERFLTKNGEGLAALVRREVVNKLETGVKRPRRG